MELVEQLRHYADLMAPSGLGGPGFALSPDKRSLLTEAAEEIERLRERVEYLSPFER
jgi:hypothetical protein